jgi:EAL domain-containing protein (putative c-di-GMP-specific phosphodiesterase class I)
LKRFELERAIAENELLLYYQPIVSVPERALRAAEALLRWKHPARGIVSPMEFVPEAEATGLIRRLTFWVLREALLQSNVWRRDGQALTVAVNLSNDNLHDQHFRRFLDRTLKVAGGPDHLIAETAARALANDPHPPLATLALMRENGIRFAIDDLTEDDASAMDSLPVDIVKIGRALVSRIRREARALDEVRAAVRAARERGLETTAVGVEDEATWDLLAKLGVANAQGYFIAQPMPAADLATWRAARV